MLGNRIQESMDANSSTDYGLKTCPQLRLSCCSDRTMKLLKTTLWEKLQIINNYYDKVSARIEKILAHTEILQLVHETTRKKDQEIFEVFKSKFSTNMLK